MSLAGFKKQINKANQYMSEKIGGAKGTELDYEFQEMERKIDVMGKLVDELMSRTHELLQPNPASRAKLSAVNSISKLRGTAKHNPYPQPEGQLGDCMTKHGRDMGEDSHFGKVLVEVGDSLRQMADIKYALDDAVKQNFIEPLHHMQTKDLKEVNHHRKKLSGRRLDYDCKKRRQAKGGSNITAEEITQAEQKFSESKELAETAMYNMLENDVEHISQLGAFVDAYLSYHKDSVEILMNLSETVERLRNEAMNRPRSEHVPKKAVSDNNIPNYDNAFDGAGENSGYNLTPGPPAYSSVTPTSPSKSPVGQGPPAPGRQPCCRAMFDFEPENEGELGFREGDLITLVQRIDENWYEGSLNGKNGFFPCNYVKVLVDF